MRRWRLALAAGLLVASLPALAQAVVAYTFVASPLVVAVGDVTDYTFTFTNQGSNSPGVQCTEVLFPDELWITAIGSPVVKDKNGLPNGRDWDTSQQGQWVLVQAEGGGDRLRNLESVTFTVTALATTPGAFLVDNHIHQTHDCDDSNVNGVPVPLTVLPGILPTPSPTASPTATPTATPIATPKPTAVPTPRPTPVATPDRSTPTPSPTPTPTPEASPTERPPAPTAVPSPDASSGATGIRVAPVGGGGDGGDGGATDNLGVGVDVLGLLDSPFEWLVPGAFVGGPGLLVLLFVGLQAAGALAWIPAVRRMGADDPEDRRRRRSRPVSRGA